jgi:hypothetical protein
LSGGTSGRRIGKGTREAEGFEGAKPVSVESVSESDRELLEYAAKAAGIEIRNIGFVSGPHLKGTTRAWNPLTNDGDAFRLSVSLRLPVVYFCNCPPYEPPRVVISIGSGVVENVVDGDWQAATRRAIVRAAAEIGRRMTDE